MSSGAWIMMLSTWAIVIVFTTRFFLKILRTPPSDERD